jgi:hypothetical protein
MPRPLRYRQCPACQTILRAPEFLRAPGPTYVFGGQRRRQCPPCGFIGPLMSFTIAMPPAELEEGAPS